MSPMPYVLLVKSIRTKPYPIIGAYGPFSDESSAREWYNDHNEPEGWTVPEVRPLIIPDAVTKPI